MIKSRTDRGCAVQIIGLAPKFKFKNPEKFCAFSGRGRSFAIPVVTICHMRSPLMNLTGCEIRFVLLGQMAE